MNVCGIAANPSVIYSISVTQTGIKYSVTAFCQDWSTLHFIPVKLLPLDFTLFSISIPQ